MVQKYWTSTGKVGYVYTVEQNNNNNNNNNNNCNYNYYNNNNNNNNNNHHHLYANISDVPKALIIHDKNKIILMDIRNRDGMGVGVGGLP